MTGLKDREFRKIVIKLKEFMQFTQKVAAKDSYLIVNRNSPILAQAAEKAAQQCELDVAKFDLDSPNPYEHFPDQLIATLQQHTPKAGIGFFDYSVNPDWNLKEVGARIELLHKTIEKVPISWAHSPGITLDMALKGPIQCNYQKMAQESDRLLEKLAGVKKMHISAPAGTNIEVEIPQEIKFDTDCTIIPPNIYGRRGKFGNLPVGEVWSQKDEIIDATNKETGKTEKQSYPVKHIADGILVCDVTAGGYTAKINPEKPLIAKFKNGVLTEIRCDDHALDALIGDVLGSAAKYGLETVLEEVGIGLNDKARVTGNMLEDEKIRGTCHLAPGNIRCHVDMLINNPTIIAKRVDGTEVGIMYNGKLA